MLVSRLQHYKWTFVVFTSHTTGLSWSTHSCTYPNKLVHVQYMIHWSMFELKCLSFTVSTQCKGNNLCLQLCLIYWAAYRVIHVFIEMVHLTDYLSFSYLPKGLELVLEIVSTMGTTQLQCLQCTPKRPNYASKKRKHFNFMLTWLMCLHKWVSSGKSEEVHSTVLNRLNESSDMSHLTILTLIWSLP